MIEDVWEKMISDSLVDGYSFRKIGLPFPDIDTISKCRELCEQNLCGAYGVTWGCPPGVGAEKDCLEMIGCFSKAAVIMKRFDDVNVEDKELLERLGAEHQDVCRKFGNALRQEGFEVLPLSDGGCKYCGICSYPDDPCRFPDQLVASISSFGILMDEYLGSQNIEFTFEKDSVTLYGLILYNEH